MDQHNNSTKDEMDQVALTIGKILQIGVIISAIIMLFGLILMLIDGDGGYANNYFPTNFSEVAFGLLTLKPYAVMMAGVFGLILTPVLRVVVSIYSFYKEKDFLYVTITTIVLIILMICFVFGVKG